MDKKLLLKISAIIAFILIIAAILFFSFYLMSDIHPIIKRVGYSECIGIVIILTLYNTFIKEGNIWK